MFRPLAWILPKRSTTLNFGGAEVSINTIKGLNIPSIYRMIMNDVTVPHKHRLLVFSRKADKRMERAYTRLPQSSNIECRKSCVCLGCLICQTDDQVPGGGGLEAPYASRDQVFRNSISVALDGFHRSGSETGRAKAAVNHSSSARPNEP